MAKHMVKCSLCGEMFDEFTTESVKTSSKRFAHKICYDSMSKEQRDKLEFESYLGKLFGKSINYVLCNQLIKRYINVNHYTYHGMMLTLKYFYEVQHNPVEKANGSIAIIPYCYNDAKKYYTELCRKKKINNNKDLSSFYNEVEVCINAPKAEKKNHRLFFEEEE